MKIKKIILFCTLLVILSGFAAAAEPDRILSNSEDWRDVYTIMQYGTLQGKTTNFLVSNKHATLIMNQISKTSHIWVISSKDVPYVVGYEALLNSKGFSAEEFEYDNINLELAELLTDVNKFIIIDDSYGYNAISVAPYAATTNSFVLFADSDNIRDVENFLEGRDVESIIIYGQVDREVKNALEQYNPDIINEEGDRFLNNIEIVKRYQELNHAKQTILTNGEFIEQEIMSGSQPVIFIGTNNVPDVIREYIQSSEIEVGVLIGNELVGTATTIRRQVGISVFVKFAQGSRAPQGRISQVEALDMYYLPIYNLNIEVDNIKYNRATNKLEVTLRNTEDLAAYFIGTYSLTASDGSRQTIGDVGANFIDGEQLKTVVYDVDPMPDGKISVDVFIIYGESKGSLEKEIRMTIEVETVKVMDNCQIQINGVGLNTPRKIFYVETENIGTVDCYVDMEIIDLVVAGQKTTYGLEQVSTIKAGQKKDLRIKIEDFEKEDLEDNERITVRAYYGERENSLVQILEGTFDVTVRGVDYVFWGLLVVIVVILFLIFWKRKKKKEEEDKKKGKI